MNLICVEQFVCFFYKSHELERRRKKHIKFNDDFQQMIMVADGWLNVIDKGQQCVVVGAREPLVVQIRQESYE